MIRLKNIAISLRAQLVLLPGLLLGLAIVLAGTSNHAYAHTASIIPVSDCSTESALSTAIGSAMSGDIIKFNCSGTIPITTTVVIGKDLTLDGSGQTVTLDGGHTTQVLSVSSGVTFTLKNLTIAHGMATFNGGGLQNKGTVTIIDSTFDHNSAPNGDGGGLDNEGTVTITNSAFTYNSANFNGGGLLNGSSDTVTITNSTFDHNSVVHNGGGLENEGKVTINHSAFTNNMATVDGGGLASSRFGINLAITVTISNSIFDHNSAPNGNGGGLFNNGLLSITNSSFTRNSTFQCGGLDNNGVAHISNSTFARNSTTGSGGGGGLCNLGTLTVAKSTFANNSGFIGGGLANESLQPDAFLSITNSTFAGNLASFQGGAIGNSGKVIIAFSTFAKNTAPTGNGGGIENVSSGILKIKASIVAKNTGGNCAGSGTTTDDGYNLEGSTDCGFTASTDLQNKNPLLGPLANNGGPTQTLALASTSPAVDQVPSTVCAAVATDQRGVTRPDGTESACDIGAYEHLDQLP